MGDWYYKESFRLIISSKLRKRPSLTWGYKVWIALIIEFESQCPVCQPADGQCGPAQSGPQAKVPVHVVQFRAGPDLSRGSRRLLVGGHRVNTIRLQSPPGGPAATRYSSLSVRCVIQSIVAG